MGNLLIGPIQIQAIEPGVDAAFQSFYKALLSSTEPDKLSFDNAASVFLRSTSAPSDHDSYFNNFTPVWQIHLQQQQYSAAEAVWPWALRPVLALESTTTSVFHKGTPYYFWGMTALLSDRLDVGYLLMHRAFEEDVRTLGSAAPNTPGWALVTLDHHRPDQAFRDWVRLQALAVEDRIARYNASHSRTFTLAVLRRSFLTKPEYRDIVQLYCYTMARILRLLSLPPELWRGPFPAQVAFESLFDLCLVIDATIHNKYSADWRFIALAAELSRRASLGLTQSDLGEINGAFGSNFSSTLSRALAGSLTMRSGGKVQGLAASLAIAYGCRNRGAHSVASVPLTPEDYDQVVEHLSAVFFLSIEAFYP